jgi:signal transduction histidine kinase/ActR/RegA family two-component response regulator
MEDSRRIPEVAAPSPSGGGKSLLRLDEVEVAAGIGSLEFIPSTGVLQWSRQLRALLEITPAAAPTSFEQFVDQHVLPDDRVDWLRRWQRCLQAADGSSWTSRIRATNGLIRPVRCRLAAERPGPGPVSRVLGILQDISQERELERLRTELEKQILQSRKLDALGVLAGGIAHDFNNILGAIMGNAEVAQMDLEPGHIAAAAVDDVVKASKRARDLIRRVLSFTQHHEGNRQRVPLAKVIKETVSLMRGELPPDIELVRDIESQLPPVLADAGQISQLLVNLWTNALEAMAGHPGRLTLRLRRHRVSTPGTTGPVDLAPGDYIQLTVADTGRGMTAEVHQHIFEPFFTTKPPGQGIGLGLAVVHGIAKVHGAAVGVETQPGAGTSFHVYFPAIESRPEAPVHPQRPLTRGGGQIILVVDDELPVLESLQRMLTSLGYRPRTESSPEAVLRELRENPRACDAIILDLSMPTMAGLELASALRDLGLTIPIVLNTGHLSQRESEALRTPDGLPVLTKPNAIRELADALDSVFQGTPPRSEDPAG